MLKRLVIALVALLALSGTVYAACHYNTNAYTGSVDFANARRFAVQCMAVRLNNGTWNTSSGGTYIEKSGLRYSADAPVCSNGWCTINIREGATGAGGPIRAYTEYPEGGTANQSLGRVSGPIGLGNGQCEGYLQESHSYPGHIGSFTPAVRFCPF